MKKIVVYLSILLATNFVFSQEDRFFLEKGNITAGVRTTVSLFGHDKVPGLGTGGQFRLQLFEKLNTEWFADWITMDLKGAGTRKNAHIGWSVLFYPKKMDKFTPYLMAGHCFDYVEVAPLSTVFVDRSNEQLKRWSSAVQVGIGNHFFLSDHFNLTLSAQYMLHLGKHLDYTLSALEDGGHYLNTNLLDPVEEELEGHLLFTVSLNYKIGDLW